MSIASGQKHSVVSCRDYQTCFGTGFATLRLMVPGEYSKEDIADLREWFSLIDRQLERLERMGN